MDPIGRLHPGHTRVDKTYPYYVTQLVRLRYRLCGDWVVTDCRCVFQFASLVVTISVQNFVQAFCIFIFLFLFNMPKLFNKKFKWKNIRKRLSIENNRGRSMPVRSY